MLPKDKNKMNLQILQMLRDKGAPALTPFPGEQDFETSDMDLDQMGDVLIAGNKPMPEEKKAISDRLRERDRKKKKRQESPEDFVPADESIPLGGGN